MCLHSWPVYCVICDYIGRLLGATLCTKWLKPVYCTTNVCTTKWIWILWTKFEFQEKTNLTSLVKWLSTSKCTTSISRHTARKKLSSINTYLKIFTFTLEKICRKIFMYNSNNIERWGQETSSSAVAERPCCSVGQCGPNINIVSVFKKHCCRLLLQLVSSVNRQRLKCHRMQRRRANGWFTSRTKFAFKEMSPTNYLCTDR